LTLEGGRGEILPVFHRHGRATLIDPSDRQWPTSVVAAAWVSNNQFGKGG
jgi:hypothetical protein